MENKMFEFAKGRYVNPRKILSVNIYQKESNWRVAIELDASYKEQHTVYSDPFTIYEAAQAYVNLIPLS